MSKSGRCSMQASSPQSYTYHRLHPSIAHHNNLQHVDHYSTPRIRFISHSTIASIHAQLETMAGEKGSATFESCLSRGARSCPNRLFIDRSTKGEHEVRCLVCLTDKRGFSQWYQYRCDIKSVGVQARWKRTMVDTGWLEVNKRDQAGCRSAIRYTIAEQKPERGLMIIVEARAFGRAGLLRFDGPVTLHLAR